MGTDFIRNIRERHKKAWRYGLARVESDWVAQAAPVMRVVRAKQSSGAKLTEDQAVLLRLVSERRVVATAGIHEVATLESPSAALVKSLEARHGMAAAKVHRVFRSAARVDLLMED